MMTEPCPVCGAQLEVKFTQRGKPYWQCDACIVQVFVRGKDGIRKIRAKWARRGHRLPSGVGSDELFG